MKDPAKKSVLVADDSALMRMLISKTISKYIQGITFTEAVNGVDAIAKMPEQGFDLVMPEMGGLQP